MQLVNGTIGQHKVNVTLITESQEFFMNGSNWQGILGLGFQGIAQPTDNPPIPFFDTLVSSGIDNGNSILNILYLYIYIVSVNVSLSVETLLSSALICES